VKTGLHPNIDRATYDAHKAANYSTLKHFRRTPAHARVAIEHPAEASDAQAFGTAVHCALLEPAKFVDRYTVMPDLTTGCKNKDGTISKSPKSTDDYKKRLAAFEAANVGKLLLEPEEAAACKAIAESIAACRTASELLTGPGKNELGVAWNDRDSGSPCKAMLDRLTQHEGRTCVVDIKTTQDASESAFAWDVYRYGYYLQAAWYLIGLNSLAVGLRRFVFIAIETKPPFAVAVYELDAESILIGMEEMRGYMREFEACRAMGVWPGYADEVKTITLPRRAFSKEQDYVAE
jgi:exodeoxyribonuclease VIII